MSFYIGILAICIIGLLCWALSSNGKVATLGLAVFTAALACILMGGAGHGWARF
jgi:hypothetical protein